MQAIKFTMGLILAFLACAAQAAPVTVNSLEEFAGERVNITLHTNGTETLEGAATVSISYDPTRLNFVSGVAGSLFDPFFADMGSADVIAPGIFPNPNSDRNLLIAFLNGFPVADNTAGSLLSLEFEIISGLPAGTETFVYFDCYDSFGGTVPGNCKPGDPASLDYAFAQAESKITVLAATGTPIPLPGTLPLIGLGLTALLWARRLRH